MFDGQTDRQTDRLDREHSTDRHTIAAGSLAMDKQTDRQYSPDRHTTEGGSLAMGRPQYT